MNNQKENLTVTTFYKFVDIDDLQELKISLLKFCELNFATGTILLAPEGINGTICANYPSREQKRNSSVSKWPNSKS